MTNVWYFYSHFYIQNIQFTTCFDNQRTGIRLFQVTNSKQINKLVILEQFYRYNRIDLYRVIIVTFILMIYHNHFYDMIMIVERNACFLINIFLSYLNSKLLKLFFRDAYRNQFVQFFKYQKYCKQIWSLDYITLLDYIRSSTLITHSLFIYS